MSKKNQTEGVEPSPRERRSYFRLDDEVHLEARRISPEQLEDELKTVAEKRQAFSYMNTIICQKEQFLPQKRYIEKNHPEIASYFNYIDHKLDALARMLVEKGDAFEVSQTQKINLSATGARITVMEAYQEGDMVELKMQLLPSMARIYVIGVVVWSCELKDSHENVTEIAIDFTHIDLSDREVIIKHLHDRQMESLNRNR